MEERKPIENPKREFKKLPYVTQPPDDGRIVFLHPYYDDQKGDWKLFLPVAGKLQRIKGGEPVVACYFASAPVETEDIFLPLGTLIAKHMSYQGVTGAWFNIVDKISQFACLLEQYNILTKHRSSNGVIMLGNELDYLFRLIRSFYDEMQKLIKNSAKLLVDANDRQKSLVQELPNSFADIVLYNKQIVSKQKLKAKYGLFEPLLSFYRGEAQQFKILKDARDGLTHHGGKLPTIFDLEDGAAIDASKEPWDKFSFCSSDQLKENGLGPLRGLFYYLVKQVLGIKSRFGKAFTSRIGFRASPIDKNISLYLRHPFGEHINSLEDVLADPWENV